MEGCSGEAVGDQKSCWNLNFDGYFVSRPKKFGVTVKYIH